MAKAIVPSDSSRRSSGRRSLPNNVDSLQEIPAPPPCGDHISATTGQSLRADRNFGTSGNPVPSQTTAQTSIDNKQAMFLKRNRSPTPHRPNSPEPSNHIGKTWIVTNSWKHFLFKRVKQFQLNSLVDARDCILCDFLRILSTSYKS